MPNLGGAEILVILLVALLVLGPDKLPGAARSVGRGLSHLRRLSGGFEREIRSAMGEADAAAGTSAPTAGQVGTGGVHPGLGPGPKLGAASVSLNGPRPDGDRTAPAGRASTGAGGRTTAEGPDESFS